MQLKVTENLFRARDPWSALTHFIAFLAAIPAMPILLLRAVSQGGSIPALLSLSIFTVSMMLLYGASTAYHAFQLSPSGNRFLKKLDHIMIFYLIAGSYTPICIIALGGAVGRNLLILVWMLAAAGTVFALCWVTCPKWVSSVIYIAMGWSCLTAMKNVLASLPSVSSLWLFLGGIAYTLGGVIYALKPKKLQQKAFGTHEIFHVFVMIGSLFHYICMYPIL